MESEKVKEIKKALECCRHSIKGGCKDCPYHNPNEDCQEFLIWNMEDYINELESENDAYYERATILRRENEQLKTLVDSLENQKTELKDRIAELEEYIKGNEADAKAFVNGWRKDLETELKQFAERLKESASQHYVSQNGVRISDITYSISDGTINKILKECIDD
jgi:predicted nuclease with TOPRIM domain